MDLHCGCGMVLLEHFTGKHSTVVSAGTMYRHGDADDMVIPFVSEALIPGEKILGAGLGSGRDLLAGFQIFTVLLNVEIMIIQNRDSINYPVKGNDLGIQRVSYFGGDIGTGVDHIFNAIHNSILTYYIFTYIIAFIAGVYNVKSGESVREMPGVSYFGDFCPVQATHCLRVTHRIVTNIIYIH